jgi:hypothetical protein
VLSELVDPILDFGISNSTIITIFINGPECVVEDRRPDIYAEFYTNTELIIEFSYKLLESGKS